MEKRTVNLEIRSTNVEERKLEGYAAVFNENYTLLRDRWGEKFYERVMPGAFKDTIKERADDIFMLINHDWNKVVGRSNSNLTLEEDEKGLRFELTIPNTTDGNDLLENVKNGLIRGCSFGFNIKDEETRWDEKWNFYRDITKVELFEITATPIPAYADTEISARSDLSLKDIKPDEAREKEPEVNPKVQKNKINKRSVDIMSAFFNAFK
ncbi:HK97 family phage prohead protease [Clostridium sp.]|uniref:HK97 family phage prohead protease n=1 Tax=Clostridium sp. TaxID=1506 RepID=UPI0035231076